MEGQASNQEDISLREITRGMMYCLSRGKDKYYITYMHDEGIIRLLGCGITQGFDNIERKPLEVFCKDALKNRDLNLVALDRMSNESDKASLLEDLKETRKELGHFLYNRIIRFVEKSTCKPKQLLQKIKLLVGTQQYEILKRLHFEIESEAFSKSLNVFYQFCEIHTQ